MTGNLRLDECLASVDTRVVSVVFEILDLVLVWNLVLGAWNFPPSGGLNAPRLIWN